MKTMIMVAPNGARLGKADHPAFPITAQELAQEAVACAQEGATAIHLHVRNDEGRHVLDAKRYEDALSKISRVIGDQIAVQITTEAVGMYSASQQMACVMAVNEPFPASVSVAVREITPEGSENGDARGFFAWLKTREIAPQFILYDESDVRRFFKLQEEGVFPFEQPFLLFVLGRYSKDQQSAPEDLDPFLSVVGKRDVHWAVCAFGRQEADCAVYAAQRGGHVRIGFENNLLMPDGTTAASNSMLVSATRKMLEEAGCQIMSAKEARHLLRLSLR